MRNIFITANIMHNDTNIGSFNTVASGLGKYKLDLVDVGW
jgi:hypothetical protein